MALNRPSGYEKAKPIYSYCLLRTEYCGKEFEKTKPILGKVKSKKAKGKIKENPELLRMGNLKKQTQL